MRPCYAIREPRRSIDEVRHAFIHRLLLYDNRNTHNQLRLYQSTFFKLVEVLKNKGLRSTKNVDVEEQVAMFLYVIGHNVRLRVVAFYFSHSVSTVHRHFISVLRAIQRITGDYMKQPGSNDTLLQQSVTQRSFSHYFKDCVGAIDGSYIPAMVNIEDQPRYRTRNGRIAQNVMAAVGFDMKFTYVLAGWEGSARDPKVLKAAVRDAPTKLLIPAGNPIAF
ncbi:hypothetical protein HHK36_013518 [Tetracentron sinense]|uniref:DUF8040 domain-containing protein n=1 Tax=Tetracentron sinense TaxID=13715 RepID=A0A834ZAI2_TETSI|nr:hypothetical protein HHK36_013518 [Tetracentron sinense]